MSATRERYREAAGLAFLGTGAVSVLGTITAEALFPEYHTGRNTISRLGTTAPEQVVRPSATIFNASMIVAGLLVLVAAYCLYRLDWSGPLVGVVSVTGLGVAGVGVFPTQFGAVHAVVAFAAFLGGGAGAVLVGRAVGGPFGYVSGLLGAVSLAALVGFVGLQNGTPLGVGGLERWVTYPIQLWAVALGGYLLGTTGEAVAGD